MVVSSDAAFVAALIPPVLLGVFLLLGYKAFLSRSGTAPGTQTRWKALLLLAVAAYFIGSKLVSFILSGRVPLFR